MTASSSETECFFDVCRRHSRLMEIFEEVSIGLTVPEDRFV